MTEKLDYWQRVSRDEIPISAIAASADLKVMTVSPGHATVQDQSIAKATGTYTTYIESHG